VHDDRRDRGQGDCPGYDDLYQFEVAWRHRREPAMA
jgi:hypothetical protein